jgi:hypothetical protein
MLKAILGWQLLSVASLVIIFFMFYIIIKSTIQGSTELVEYDVAQNVEAISSLISALANSPHNASVVYLLPEGKCTLSITEDYVEMSIPQQTIELQNRKLELNTKSSKIDIIRPVNVKIQPISLDCNSNRKLAFAIEKNESGVWFESL